MTRGNSTAPPTDFLSTGGVSVVTSGSLTTVAGMQQILPFGGGNYQVSWDGSRAHDRRAAHGLQPAARLASELRRTTSRCCATSGSTRSVSSCCQSQNQQQVADIQLRQRITQTARNVRAAYYNLVGAIAGLDVAQQSLDLARQSLKNNQTRVEVGTMAPIDIVSAEAEVASNEENVIIAEAAIETRAGSAARARS